jgi:predicted RNA-binding protein with PIN domain
MKKVIIVDGYNAIHRSKQLARLLDRSLEAAREGLVVYCAEWRAKRGDVEQFTVVFDGNSSVVGGRILGRPGIKVVYTATGETADERILQIIRPIRDHHRYIVVSDDNDVSGSARAMKMEAMPVARFAGTLRSGPRTMRGETDGDDKSLAPAQRDEINRDLRRAWGIENQT